MKHRKPGRPKGRPTNHHLILRDGVWIFRLARGGRDVHRSTRCPASEVAAARLLRDKWLGEAAKQRFGIEELPPTVTVGTAIDLYLAAESNEYDRERGGRQPGTKRDAAGDRRIVNRLKPHLDFSLSAALIDAGYLLKAARGLESENYAPLSIRGTFRLLRRVFGWARTNERETGITTDPFAKLSRSDRERLFPNAIAKAAPPFTREQLRALYDLLPAHAYRPVKFGAHTGMRFHSELLRMTWGRVDFEARTYTVDPRYAKKGKERRVPLGDVAIGLLEQVRPQNPKPSDPIWLNTEGTRLRDMRDCYEKAVAKVTSEPEANKRRPDFHSLRRTLASALAKFAPQPVVAEILGHSRGTVTDLYITIPIEDQIAALNRAALLIDGEPQENVVPLTKPETKKRSSAGGAA
jgi:integrase